MKIVAVSTCTAGSAHTYMSQEALEQECEKKNWVQALISIFYYQLLMKSKKHFRCILQKDNLDICFYRFQEKKQLLQKIYLEIL